MHLRVRLDPFATFQDKEYPMKSLTISELQKEIEQLEQQHKVLKLNLGLG